ncbi:hypothetical protein MUK42_35079 [Musa troglodytarum]|uniref:Uncharacterized protein n=1 Tax=Musa troglodytarum TaxID=320322 RepID=A0A9E7I3C1_9LILI|nr:hypothetical protein MUK42_35079 [Musa troglodytarum]
MTPPMGNTWNHFYCDINETVIRESGTNILMCFLQEKLGYRYVNIGTPLTVSRLDLL